MLLLATFNALTRKESTTEHGNDKKYLTNEYKFDEREYYRINITNHISWNFAESIQLPYSLQQKDAIYFKSLYKVAVFGICEDAFPYQINYLIEEKEMVKKEADAVISLDYNYFKNYELGENI
ncbi:chaperonin: PROVISIONAL [Gigaspora margarita]|uniref:Chaperonin: PROVISIONAL n=1 Tax=Gigaspora margarita TaxID=4874 RepID=A0A8H3XAT1_GIGMA|nr:chaperonin: PROVISIONAL [Gigaspora margarita]